MRIHLTHETNYRYERPVRSIIQVLRLTPRDHDGQHILRWRLEPSVDGLLRRREDSLGNVVHVFSAEGPAESLAIRVVGEVETHDTGGVVAGAVERVPDVFYLRESTLALADPAIREFAADVAGNLASDPLSGLHRLLSGLNREVTFDVRPTFVTTTAAEAFALRRGVCQDLAHIFVAAARHLDVPARYVSGYFRRNDQVIDQEAGHAWVEAKVPELGWVGFDPANGISVTDAYVRVAVGLDYLDAAPIRGSRTGGGSETLDVRLTVENAGTKRQGQGQSQSQSQGSGRP